MKTRRTPVRLSQVVCIVVGMDVAGGFPEDAAEGPESFGGRVDAVRRLVAGLASIDVDDLSADELVGVLVPLERLRWSVESVSSTVLHTADRRQATLELYGNFTPAHVTGFCPQTRASVKRRITNGRTLALFPGFAAAHANGRISSDHIAALGRVVNERNQDLLISVEPKLLGLAHALPYPKFVEALTYLAKQADADGPEPVDPEAGRLRHVTHGDGVVDVSLRLSPVEGASLLELLGREADRLFRRYTHDRTLTLGELAVPGRPELLCEALTNLVTQGAAAGRTGQAPVTDLTLVERLDPNLDLYRTVGLEQFFDGNVLMTLTGIRLSRFQLASRLENAVIRRMILDDHANPTHVTAPARTATAQQRRAVAVRDGGCVFPGCDCPINWCDLHHVHHFEHGGDTSVENLAPLCRRHHGVTHTNGWVMTATPDQRFVWTTPAGRTLHSQRHHTPPGNTAPPGKTG